MICFATSRWSTPIIVGTPWPMAFIVWWLLWQWMAQSPAMALNSKARICPTATSVVTSGHLALLGTQPPSVPVTSKCGPCMWMG